MVYVDICTPSILNIINYVPLIFLNSVYCAPMAYILYYYPKIRYQLKFERFRTIFMLIN